MTSISEEFRRSWLTSIIGIALLCCGIAFLTWNERRAVMQAHSLDEAYNLVVTVNPFDRIKPELEGQLVHIKGPVEIDEPVTEPEYGISISAVKLKRRVQMFQWVEERTQRDPPGQNTESAGDFYYITEWRDKIVDSSSFYVRSGHQNPTEMPLRTYVHISPSVRIGQMNLGRTIKEKFVNYNEVTGDERPERKDIKLHSGVYYHCDDVWNPEVGDIRVQFFYAGSAGEEVTIVAMQKGNTLVPYITKNGHEIAFLRHGSLTVNQMFNAEHSIVKNETWNFRLLGLAAIYASLIPLARLLSIIFYHIPFLRFLSLRELTPPINLAIAFSLSTFVVATAWILYRPWFGVGLLAASFSPYIYCAMGIFNAAQNFNNR